MFTNLSNSSTSPFAEGALSLSSKPLAKTGAIFLSSVRPNTKIEIIPNKITSIPTIKIIFFFLPDTEATLFSFSALTSNF